MWRVLVVAVCFVAAPAAGADEEFRYNGAVTIGTVVADGFESERLARCDHLMRGPAADGVFGSVIEIPTALADGSHLFQLLDGLMSTTDGLPLSNGIDFDVTFTDEMGTCVEPLANATRFQTAGNEQGLVPAGTRWAIVTMVTPQRLTSAFTFIIGGRTPGP